MSAFFSLFCTHNFKIVTTYKVRYVKLHEKYDDNQYHHDIAIVTVETPLILDRKMLPLALIQMENQYQIPKKGDFCRIAGKSVKVHKKYGFFRI